MQDLRHLRLVPRSHTGRYRRPTPPPCVSYHSTAIKTLAEDLVKSWTNVRPWTLVLRLLLRPNNFGILVLRQNPRKWSSRKGGELLNPEKGDLGHAIGSGVGKVFEQGIVVLPRAQDHGVCGSAVVLGIEDRLEACPRRHV